MPKTAHREEIEIKLRVTDRAAIRSLLKRFHARQIIPRTFESNTLYDTPGQSLRRSGRLIRIRIEQPASTKATRPQNDHTPAILTYKGPPAKSRKPSARSKTPKRHSHFKIREEAEVSLSNASESSRILRALGLRPIFRYEKFRTTYRLPGLRSLKIELDETPIGNYLELEGTMTGIDRCARLLGYNRRDYLKDSYGSLYLAECRRKNKKPADMLFSPTKKSR
jgi:adenylate cyclase class 2